MAYRVAIVDDSVTDARFVEGILTDWAGEKQTAIQAEIFSSAESFLFRYAEDKEWDILLLDIEMGAMDGVTMAKKVRAHNEAVQIVFITGYSDYIAEGYEVAALHYLMKPVNREKLARVLDRAAQSLSRQVRTVLLPVGKETLCLPADEIRYAESLGHYMIVYTGGGEYKCRMTAGEAETLLGRGFARCHRSVIVGLRHVTRVTKTAVFLTDGTELPLGKGLYDEINRALISTLREM